MRLTLRTLLAYLDNTLQPDDAEKLRQKLSDSGFATTLVRRIRASLARADLSSPSPDAVGPVEDANLTSEYLDSTLPHEQVAEIERAALESDSQLAETAACHQILTMVLGRPANVSQELRQRIYELPQRDLGEISDGLALPTSSFSAIDMNAETQPLTLGNESLGSDVDSDNVLTAPAQRAIEPVGKTDSGVTDAPDRLRSGGAETAGSRAARIDDAYRSTGGGRMKQVMPLLVSLAVCAVLLFALSRVFQPLLNNNRSMADASLSQPVPELPPVTDSINADVAEIIPPPQPEMSVAELPLPDGNAVAEAIDVPDMDVVDSLPMPAPLPLPVPETEVSNIALPDIGEPDSLLPEAIAPQTMEPGEAMAEPALARVDPDTVDPEGLMPPAPETDSKPDPNAELVMPVPQPEPDNADLTMPPMPDGAVASKGAPTTDAADAPIESIAALPEMTMPVPEPAIEGVVAGKRIGPPTLMVRLIDREWQRIRDGDEVLSDQFLVAAPSFKSTIAVDDRFEVTLLGPAAGRLIREGDLTIVRIDFGRLIVRAKADGVEVPLFLGDELIGLNLDTAETTAAVSVTIRRPPGADPLAEDTRMTQISLLAAKGKIDWAGENDPQTLITGQGWTRIDDGPYQPLTLTEMPPWVESSDDREDKSLEATARKGLLALLVDQQPLLQSLREATLFRRAEVVDLAAETLLAMGQAETYFGGDGILNDPKQRIYWSKHFEALVTTINRNPIFAEAIFNDAKRMDSANGDAIAKLLTGYSQSDLETGGDQELVAMLQHPSMTIRALAIANLKTVTGTTLLYRADYDTESRRNAGVKKWMARLRKGDIRWPQKKRVDAETAKTNSGPNPAVSEENTDESSEPPAPAEEAPAGEDE